MINLINTLFYRIRKTPTFWIMLALCVVLPLFGAVVVYGGMELIEQFLESMGGMEGVENIASLLDPLASVGAQVNISSDFCVMAAIAIAILLGGEFSNGTIRNSVLSKKSRPQIYGAYAVISILIAICLATVYTFSSYAFYTMFFGMGDYQAGQIVASIFSTWGLTLLVSILVAMITLFFVVATKKVSMGIVLPLLVCLVVPGILELFFMVDILFNTVDYAAMSWVPFLQYTTYNAVNLDGAVIAKIAGMTTLLAAAFGGFGLLILTQSDLK